MAEPTPLTPANIVAELDKHIAIAGDDERGLGVSHREHGLESAQHAVGTPVFGKLDRGTDQMAGVLLQLCLKSLEECERISRAAGEPGEHLAIVQTADLACARLDHDVAERDLTVTAQRNAAVATDRDDRRAVELFQSVAVELLTQLAPLLGFERKRGGGPSKETRQPDGFASFLAETVVACIDAGNGLLDFLQQLSLAVASTQFERVFFLDRGTVCRVGDDDGLAQMLSGFTRVVEDLALHLLEPLAKERALCFIHVVRFGHTQKRLLGERFFFFRGCHVKSCLIDQPTRGTVRGL